MRSASASAVAPPFALPSSLTTVCVALDLSGLQTPLYITLRLQCAADDEFLLSKAVQLRAAVAPRGFALPKHLNLMSSDAGNRAGSAGLQSSLSIQMTRSPNASLRAIPVFMTMPSGLICSLGNARPFPL